MTATGLACEIATRVERLAEMNGNAMHDGFRIGFRVACDALEERVSGAIFDSGFCPSLGAGEVRRMIRVVRESGLAAHTHILQDPDLRQGFFTNAKEVA